MKLDRLAFLTLVILNQAAWAQRQKDTATDRPKVGLVLSGGGARGLAHIAVIQAIERAGVQIDYIGGTSMGAVIAGLYAAGYNGAQIERLARQIDFFEALSHPISRRYKSYFEKKYGERYALVLPVRKGKIELPTAYSEGQKVLQVYTSLTRNVHPISDFDSLAVPYLAVATDLQTGGEVLLRRSFLPQAMYASSTFPSLLVPFEIGGKLLVDGGVVNDFPVQEVIDMGADIIIGVDARGSQRTRAQLKSISSVLTQIATFASRWKTERQVGLVDVLIRPDVDAYTTLDFNKKAQIIEKGARAARAHFTDLKRIAERQSGVSQHGNPIPPLQDSIQLGGIAIGGNESYTRDFILGKFGFAQGHTITVEQLNQGIDRIYGTGNFKFVNYKITPSDRGSELQIMLTENRDRDQVKLGLHYDDVFKTGILFNGISKNGLFKNSTLSLDIILGDRPRYAFNYFVENGLSLGFGLRSTYLNASSDSETRVSDLFKGFDWDVSAGASGALSDIDYRYFHHALFLQSSCWRQLALELGVALDDIRLGVDPFPTDRGLTHIELGGAFFVPYVSVGLDTYNRSDFATSGLRLDGGLQYIAWGSESAVKVRFRDHSEWDANFDPTAVAKAQVEWAIPIKDRFAIRLGALLGVTIGSQPPLPYRFFLGGNCKQDLNNAIPFYGYGAWGDAGKYIGKADLAFQYEFARRGYLTLFGNVANLRDSYSDLSSKRFNRDGLGIGCGLESPIGPLEIKYSYSSSAKRNRIYVNLGFWF